MFIIYSKNWWLIKRLHTFSGGKNLKISEMFVGIRKFFLKLIVLHYATREESKPFSSSVNFAAQAKRGPFGPPEENNTNLKHLKVNTFSRLGNNEWIPGQIFLAISLK